MITKTCAISGQTFTITDQDLAFYEKMDVPSPTLCPEERLKDRFLFRNRRTMFNRNCDKTDKKLISMFSPESPFPVYQVRAWYDDKHFDPLSYGRSFDFKKTFFEQLQSILDVIPHPHAAISGENENVEYCNGFTNAKSCYLCFGMTNVEKAFYSNSITTSYEVIDCLMIDKCELCYECIDCENCYQSAYLQRSKNCSNSWFLDTCIGCTNCFGCTNLRNKEFYFLNQPLSQEDYKQKIQSLNLGNHSQLGPLRKNFINFSKKRT